MYIDKTLQFTLTLGIYRRVKHVKSAGIYVFATEECHTEIFELEWDLPPKTSEIPHRLLRYAQSEAEAKAVEFQANGESEWQESGVLYEESEWDNEPVWRGDGSVLECYKYWHDAFRSVHFIKLEWEDWRKER